MNYQQLEKNIIDLLSRELDPRYVYHNVNHTLDVLESVNRIAEYENLSTEEYFILKTAALLHDIGFIRKYEENEEISAEMAAELLKDYEYTQEQISIICRMIRMTAYKMNPEYHLDRLLCDADLDYLGREDYLNKSMLLFREWRQMKNGMTLNEWYNIQIAFLEDHCYFSDYSKTYREKKKNDFLSEIKQLLNK
jgi:HD superfamily phosphodiesterase